MKSMSKKLMEARKHTKLSQVKFAKSIGISLDKLRIYEKGLEIPPDNILLTVREKTGIIISFLRDNMKEVGIAHFTKTELYPFSARIKLGIIFNFSSRLYEKYCDIILNNKGLYVYKTLDKDLVIIIFNNKVFHLDVEKSKFVIFKNSGERDFSIPNILNKIIVNKLKHEEFIK